MMRNYCTLFDSAYLSKGLVMYDSLIKELPDAHLYIFAFDQLAYDVLNSLNLKNATIISLKDFENDRLLKIKQERSRAEYCWTCTPSTIAYVLDTFVVPSCTYIDSDLFFYNSPKILTDELKNGKNVLITEHGFSKFARIFEQARAGRFCVQFITFTNEENSRSILNTWASQCIEWCYARYENGKFGDQKYLNDWPEEFRNVHILQNRGGGIAPWNARLYEFTSINNRIYGSSSISDDKFEIIFFHFHFIRFLSAELIDFGWNRLKTNTIKVFYMPYVDRIIEKENFLETRFPDYTRYFSRLDTFGIKESFKTNFKRITKYNLFKVKS